MIYDESQLKRDRPSIGCRNTHNTWALYNFVVVVVWRRKSPKLAKMDDTHTHTRTLETITFFASMRSFSLVDSNKTVPISSIVDHEVFVSSFSNRFSFLFFFLFVFSYLSSYFFFFVLFFISLENLSRSISMAVRFHLTTKQKIKKEGWAKMADNQL